MSVRTWMYVIATTEKQAEEIVRMWMFADYSTRREMEASDICFKGVADARALLDQHRAQGRSTVDNCVFYLPEEWDPQVWQVSIDISLVSRTEG